MAYPIGKKRYIHSRFWADTYIDKLDPIEKLLFLYFLTNERVTIAGIYELPLKIMAVETGIDKEMVEKVLGRFSEESKMYYIDGWVYIKNFQKYQNLENTSIKKGIENVTVGIPLKIKEKIQLIDESSTTRKPLPTKSKLESKLESKSNSNSSTEHSSDENLKQVNNLIDIFKVINPSFGLFYKRPPQRAACERLLKLHDLEWWGRFMPAYMKEMESSRFFPKATSPIRMEEKIGDIELYGKNKNKLQDKRKVIL